MFYSYSSPLFLLFYSSVHLGPWSADAGCWYVLLLVLLPTMLFCLPTIIRIEKKEGKTKSDVKKQEASIMPLIGFSKIPYKIAKFPKSDGIFGIFEMAKC